MILILPDQGEFRQSHSVMAGDSPPSAHWPLPWWLPALPLQLPSALCQPRSPPSTGAAGRSTRALRPVTRSGDGSGRLENAAWKAQLSIMSCRYRLAARQLPRQSLKMPNMSCVAQHLRRFQRAAAGAPASGHLQYLGLVAALAAAVQPLVVDGNDLCVLQHHAWQRLQLHHLPVRLSKRKSSHLCMVQVLNKQIESSKLGFRY